jgi:hypothetical protein
MVSSHELPYDSCMRFAAAVACPTQHVVTNGRV